MNRCLNAVVVIMTVALGTIGTLAMLSGYLSYDSSNQGDQPSAVEGTLGPADDEVQDGDGDNSNAESVGECIGSLVSQGSSIEEAVEQCDVGDEEQGEEELVNEQGESQPIQPLEEQEDSVQEPVSPCPEGTVLSRSEGGGAECVQPPVSPCPEGTVLGSLKGGGGECVQPRLEGGASIKKAPVAMSGSNVYVAWWTNETSNNDEEVMFRASTDGGQTFSERINLSNTTGADSERVEIDSDDDSVTVTWWERNQTADTPSMRISNDNGATFGPLLTLATNGTLGEAAEGEDEG
jgi:hypothetical protein